MDVSSLHVCVQCSNSSKIENSYWKWQYCVMFGWKKCTTTALCTYYYSLLMKGISKVQSSYPFVLYPLPLEGPHGTEVWAQVVNVDVVVVLLLLQQVR